jgi:hypothetical protein
MVLDAKSTTPITRPIRRQKKWRDAGNHHQGKKLWEEISGILAGKEGGSNLRGEKGEGSKVETSTRALFPVHRF